MSKPNKNEPITLQEYWDTPKKKEINTCRYCGKQIPEGTWWCNSIHRFWNQIGGRTRKKPEKTK